MRVRRNEGGRRDDDQTFYRSVLSELSEAPHYLRVDETGRVAIRAGQRWQTYGQKQQGEFWRYLLRADADLRAQNWSTVRQQQFWQYVWVYGTEVAFDNRYFECANAVLDTQTGELDYSEGRHLRFPTLRNTDLAYLSEYQPSKAWQKWHDSQTPQQRVVRQWSVASAFSGEHGLLLTFGNSRTGKSTVAEALSQTIGDGAKAISLSRDWGRFYTQQFEHTTYLYDPDAKGSKLQNNQNYETLHLMASGDYIQIEEKGGGIRTTQNYGFVELVSNAPTPLAFEQSLIDRVRFCLYTYIDPRGDGGSFKRRLLADRQAWLNYAVENTIALAKGDIERPPLDEYQALGWFHWLKHNNSYAKLSLEHGRAVSFSEYQHQFDGNGRFRMSNETIEETKEAVGEIERQLGYSFWATDWEDYESKLKEDYYGKTDIVIPF